ncbi:MAG: BamA/TamA family outer membrane protein [Chitinophagales bacterium]
MNSMFSQTPDTVISTQTSKKFFIVPLIAFKPETSWAFGAGAVYSFKPTNDYVANSPGYASDSIAISQTNPSKIIAYTVYTLKNQFQFDAGGSVYTKDNLWYLYANFAFYRYPSSFFGIGNNTSSQNEERYTNTHPYILLHAQKNVAKNIYAGGKIFFEHTKIFDIDSGTILFNEEIPGEEGGLNTGIGPWFTFDSRNNVNYSTKGIKAEVSTVLHNQIFGSDYNYLENNINVSYFLPVISNHILAINGYAEFLPGSPPFNRMAELGGGERMRGNYEGRFRDKHYLTVQAEYRMPFGKFFGVHLFGGTGEVANEFSAFSFNGLKYSFGAGGRIFIIPKDKLSLRIDYAFGSKSIYDDEKGKNVFDKGLYVTIGEAF